MAHVSNVSCILLGYLTVKLVDVWNSTEEYETMSFSAVVLLLIWSIKRYDRHNHRECDG